MLPGNRYFSDSSNADGIEPPGDVVTLLVDRQVLISAAWTDHDSGSIRFFLRGKIDRDRGLPDVGNRPVDHAVLATFLDLLRGSGRIALVVERQ
jgi:hypothetical protein